MSRFKLFLCLVFTIVIITFVVVRYVVVGFGNATMSTVKAYYEIKSDLEERDINLLDSLHKKLDSVANENLKQK